MSIEAFALLSLSIFITALPSSWKFTAVVTPAATISARDEDMESALASSERPASPIRLSPLSGSTISCIFLPTPRSFRGESFKCTCAFTKPGIAISPRPSITSAPPAAACSSIAAILPFETSMSVSCTSLSSVPVSAAASLIRRFPGRA